MRHRVGAKNWIQVLWTDHAPHPPASLLSYAVSMETRVDFCGIQSPAWPVGSGFRDLDVICFLQCLCSSAHVSPGLAVCRWWWSLVGLRPSSGHPLSLLQGAGLLASPSPHSSRVCARALRWRFHLSSFLFNGGAAAVLPLPCGSSDTISLDIELLQSEVVPLPSLGQRELLLAFFSPVMGHALFTRVSQSIFLLILLS